MTRDIFASAAQEDQYERRQQQQARHRRHHIHFDGWRDIAFGHYQFWWVGIVEESSPDPLYFAFLWDIEPGRRLLSIDPLFARVQQRPRPGEVPNVIGPYCKCTFGGLRLVDHGRYQWSVSFVLAHRSFRITGTFQLNRESGQWTSNPLQLTEDQWYYATHQPIETGEAQAEANQAPEEHQTANE